MALHWSPGWPAQGCGYSDHPTFLASSKLLWLLTDSPHIFLSGRLMTNTGANLNHCQGQWRKGCFRDPLRSGMITVETGKRVIPRAEGVCLIQVAGHRHFLGNSILSTCFFSPGAVSNTSNSFILVRETKFTSLLLQASRVGILLEVGPAHFEAWLGVWFGEAK